MGGNIFPDSTRRITKPEFELCKSMIKDRFKQVFSQTKLTVLESFRQKESFGDVDVIVELSPELIRYLNRDKIKQMFSVQDVHKNGNCWSLPMPVPGSDGYVQVDLIMQPSEDYETSVFYYGNPADSSNLMGRVAHRLGFQFGHRGLLCILRDGNYQFAEIMVTKDPRKIMEFLGYDFDRLQNGFNTRNEVYDFVTSTEFFNPDIFAYENRNHTARVRDRKRESYRLFLDYLETRMLDKDLIRYSYETVSELGGRVLKTGFLERAFSMFPDFKTDFDKANADHALWQTAKERFNGTIVSELTGLSGKDLGGFMQETKKNMQDPLRFCTERSADQVKEFIMERFEEWRSLM